MMGGNHNKHNCAMQANMARDSPSLLCCRLTDDALTFDNRCSYNKRYNRCCAVLAC
jgi:hypothetical protein